jgi:hypothetical protein
VLLCQTAYASKLLEKTGMKNCNLCGVPMEAKLMLSKESNSPLVDATEYRSLIGSLRYLLHTRLELTFSVSYLSRFMECPRQEHMVAIKHILRYVAGTLDFDLFYPRGSARDLGIIGYRDSDMAGDVDDSKSISRMIIFLGDNPATWSSQKQWVVALSSCEAEYIASTGVACQGIWLRRLLEELIGIKIAAPRIKMDNQSAIALSKNPVLHDWSKHIKTKYHFIRECMEREEVCVEFVGTRDQLTNILTKPLARVRFQELRGRIGVTRILAFEALN